MSWDHTRSPFARWTLETEGSGLLSYLPMQDDEFTTDGPVQALAQGGHPWETPGTVGRTDGPTTGDAGALRLFDEPTAGAYVEQADPTGTRIPAFAGAFSIGLWVRHAAGDNTTWGRLTSRDGWVGDALQFQVVSPGSNPNDALNFGLARGGAQLGNMVLDTADFGGEWTWWVFTWREVGSGGDSRSRLYRNGALLSTSPVASPSDGWATTPNRMAGVATPGIEWTDVAHHAVWDRALTATEVAAGWEAAHQPAYTPPPPRGWQAVIVDRDGIAKQYVRPRGLRIEQRLNGPVRVSFTVDLAEGDTSEVMVGSRGVRLLREGIMRFQGPIVAPLNIQLARTRRTVTVNAVSPLGVLERRFIRDSTDVAAAEFTSTDAGAIAEALLDIANAQEQTHLRIGDVDTSVNRDRSYELGKQIGEAVAQLAGVRNGFWFRDRPVTGEGAVWAALDILYPDPGIDRPGARFSFGAGTGDSLQEAAIEVGLPVNDVLAIGAQDEATQQPLTAHDDDPTSIGEFGLWGAVVTYADVSIQATLDDHAAEAIEADPPRIYTVKPLPTRIDEEGRSPRLWEEFDVGDTVRLTIRDTDAFDVEGASARVLAATVAVSDDAMTETLESIDVEVVA